MDKTIGGETTGQKWGIAMKGERQEAILRLLQERGSVTTARLVKEFGVSIETIRRDINDLAAGRRIRKVYGGIERAAETVEVEELDSWGNRLSELRAEKEAIASRAVELIPDGSTIALDIGTTALTLARLLYWKQDLTIIVSSLRIAAELLRGGRHRVYLVGGLLHPTEQVTMGAFARSFVDNFASIDLFVGSADGLSLDYGITEFNEAVADVKSQLTAISRRTLILADHSKFGKKALFKSCPMGVIDQLVTDSGTPAPYLEALDQLGIEVFVAKL